MKHLWTSVLTILAAVSTTIQANTADQTAQSHSSRSAAATTITDACSHPSASRYVSNAEFNNVVQYGSPDESAYESPFENGVGNAVFTGALINVLGPAVTFAVAPVVTAAVIEADHVAHSDAEDLERDDC